MFARSRRASKSANLDVTLGPPLRLTDIEHYTPSEQARKWLEEKENAPSDKNSHEDVDDGKVNKGSLNKPLTECDKNAVPSSEHRMNTHKPSQCIPTSTNGSSCYSQAHQEGKEIGSATDKRAVSNCQHQQLSFTNTLNTSKPPLVKHSETLQEPRKFSTTHPTNCPHSNKKLLVDPSPAEKKLHPSAAAMSAVSGHFSQPPPLGFMSFGKFELDIGSRRLHKISVLGRGGSSHVFKVFCDDGNLYALKEIYMKASPPEVKAAYINEIKLLKKLRGKPQIITLYDYTWDQDEAILRLLLEHGEMDLGELIRSRQATRPLREDPLLLMFLWQQMLSSVKIIHDEGIIHNDLKPENFVCGGSMQLKLIDFGIANKIEEEHTSIERDIRCGTANYMAPECIMTYDNADFFKIGRPADVWSLGCILHQMIFHRTPFEHIKGKTQKFHAITNPSLKIVLPETISNSSQEVITQCLQRNPKARPTIEQLLQHDFIAKLTI